MGENGMNHNTFPKVAVINDMTGFGRCALAVELPIISHFGLQCCPIPTSIWSNHSAFESFYKKDFTREMPEYIGEWEKLGLVFQGILTGYYGSSGQIEIVKNFIKHFQNPNTIVVVDPILGDHGKMYSATTKELCDNMAQLAELADVIVPNLTELCILTETTYREDMSYGKIMELCEQLAPQLKTGARIVVTGITKGSRIGNLIYDSLLPGTYQLVQRKTAGENRCGTGDVFASVLMGSILCGMELTDAVEKAADFVGKCIKESDRLQIPKTDGVCFERLLKHL